MNTQDERLEAAAAALTQGIQDLIAGGDWKRYLKAQAAFHTYSFSNLMWLLSQARVRGVDVSRFAGYKTWQKLDRQVRKGEKAFNVLAPLKFHKKVEKDGVEKDVFGIRGFRVESTFDISQTDGEPFPEGGKELEGTSDEVRANFDKLAAWSTARGVPVYRRATGDDSLGFYSTKDKIIVVDPDLSDLQAFNVLVHEVTHSILHRDMVDRHQYAYNEVEAESTAYMVMNVLGYDSSDFAFGYVAGWSKSDPKIVKTVAENVQKTAKLILGVFKTETPADE